jgi:peptidyl-Lys metalloendopeptidase
MFRSMRWILAAALAVAAATLGAAPRDGLDVRISAATPVLHGDVDVVVTVTVTNTTRHPVHVLAWQLPSDEVEGALFKITRDGEAVRYTGPLVKRAAAQAADHVRIDAGATLSYEVELSAAYDLSRNGRYAVEYASRGAQGAKAAELKSETLYLWLEGRSGKGVAQAAPAPAAAATTYTSCSASQQTALAAAVSGAQTYANGAVSYLGGAASATPRYTTWFGTYSSAGRNTAQAHFTAVKAAFDNQPLAFDCKCKKRGTYAYVYANQPYKIYLCGAFWSAPLTGTDSRAGTLIHEMTHFEVVAGTNDWAYGQTAAKALAISNPTQALDNADSHEYFAENTPAQP